MTKHRLMAAAAAALLIAPGAGQAPAGDHYQLIRSAGLTAEQAAGMSLDEIAAHKFSREGEDGRQVAVPAPRRATVAPRAYTAANAPQAARSLDDIYVELINRSVGYDERQTPSLR